MSDNTLLSDDLLNDGLQAICDAAHASPFKNSNAWINGTYTNAHIRFGHRSFKGIPLSTLEISNITVKEEFRSKGVFKSLLAHVMQNYTAYSIYVENVFSEELASFLLKQGFQEIDHYSSSGIDDGLSSYIFVR